MDVDERARWCWDNGQIPVRALNLVEIKRWIDDMNGGRQKRLVTETMVKKFFNKVQEDRAFYEFDLDYCRILLNEFAETVVRRIRG